VLHHNPTSNTLAFQLGSRFYSIPPGAEAEIPDHLVYCVKKRGLPLSEGSGGEGAARVTAKPASQPKAQALPPGVTVREAIPADLEAVGVDPGDPSEESGEVPDEVQRAAAAIKRKATAKQEARLAAQAAAKGE